jgi:signal transduction histidine kinase
MLPYSDPDHTSPRPTIVHGLTGAHDPRRELALISLLEMSRELAFSLDLFETVDLLMFNLMGQFGCARSAFWLLGGEDESGPILLKSHGFPPETARRTGQECSGAIHRYLDDVRSPVLTDWLVHSLEPGQMDQLRHGQFALFAPLVARGRLLGWISLGPRLDGSGYQPRDMQLLEAALGMVASSLESALLMMSLQENNRQLRASNERLTELDRLKTEFLSNVNHELRTPVAVVIATLDSLQGFLEQSEEPRRLLEGAMTRAQDLHRLLETLLTFSEIADARLRVSIGMADTAEFMDELIAARRPGLTSQLRSLEYSRGSSLPPVLTDPSRLGQVLNELIDNAVKFGPKGSAVRVTAEAEELDGARWVRIMVADDGPGIEASTAAHLFESFRQGDGSSVRRFGGLGIGLALARNIMERMEGQLELSNPGEAGACFVVRIPVGQRHTKDGVDRATGPGSGA